MSEIYRKGEEVPREWFTRLEGVERVTFGRDCSMAIEDGVRVIRAVGEGEYMAYFHNFGDGTPMDVDADPPIYWMTQEPTI